MSYYAGDCFSDHPSEPADIETYPDYTLSELEEMPTLAEGQADDLKIDDGAERVWLSRCTTADGEPCDDSVNKPSTARRARESRGTTHHRRGSC